MSGAEEFRGPREKAVALAVPWVFVAAFAAFCWRFLLPRAGDNLLLMILVVFAGLALISFTAAALTFSRDVIANRPI